jgi:F-type H+-transporting ATPase subunit b
MLKRIVLLIAVATWFIAAPIARAADEHEATKTVHEAAKTAANVPGENAQARESGAAAPHGEHDAHKAPPLLPDPFDRTVQLQALWVVIIFVVLLAILYKTAWKNILIGLKKREERIRQDIKDAEDARKRAEATLKQYNEQLAAAEGKVREMIAKATVDGERIATTIRMQAQNDAEEIKERTARDLEAARKQAVAEFREFAATIATKAAEQILCRTLNEQDQRDLVNRSLDQLENVNS